MTAYLVQECPELRTLEHHIRDVPWAQLMQECVICCLAAACAAMAPGEVLRAYRQVAILHAAPVRLIPSVLPIELIHSPMFSIDSAQTLPT